MPVPLVLRTLSRQGCGRRLVVLRSMPLASRSLLSLRLLVIALLGNAFIIRPFLVTIRLWGNLCKCTAVRANSARCRCRNVRAGSASCGCRALLANSPRCGCIVECLPGTAFAIRIAARGGRQSHLEGGQTLRVCVLRVSSDEEQRAAPRGFRATNQRNERTRHGERRNLGNPCLRCVSAAVVESCLSGDEVILKPAAHEHR
mmetsp:Transcript_106805/g.298987  ORF Transcript_106805/g.298987 Transcript_106805/m.298987 type:complete len:202 (+) Transcript_106805:148-753(+)